MSQCQLKYRYQWRKALDDDKIGLYDSSGTNSKDVAGHANREYYHGPGDHLNSFGRRETLHILQTFSPVVELVSSFQHYYHFFNSLVSNCYAMTSLTPKYQ